MAARLLADTTVLVLGGAGLVGKSIARRLALLKPSWRPSRVIVASLFEREARAAVASLEQEQDERLQSLPVSNCDTTTTLKKPVEFAAVWGDVFVRSEYANMSRMELLRNDSYRQELLVDLYDDFGAAYDKSKLVHLLREHRPNILVDCLNTATGLSYQNIFDAAKKVRQSLQYDLNSTDELSQVVEKMLATQSIPALIRHVQILSRAAQEVGIEQYLKIGTTGTGGMGMNLPFTHSEAKPSNLLLAKNEAAFGHTGLLYLWSLTPGAPMVMEIKPAAAIGWRNVGVTPVIDRFGNDSLRRPEIIRIGVDNTCINVRASEQNYPKVATMKTDAVDMGENGAFAAGEFLTLSSPGTMELVSPEEIAEVSVQELLGISTGKNVLSSIRGAVLGPGYRAGTLIQSARDLLEQTKHSNGSTVPSIAMGKLGPATSKMLFESHILAIRFRKTNGLKKLAECNPADLAQELSLEFRRAMTKGHDFDADSGEPTCSSVAYLAPTIGMPILLEGNLLLRGPNITVPEPVGHDSVFAVSLQEDIDRHAQSGWVDLTRSNLEVWKKRAQQILSEPATSAKDTTSLTGLHYQSGADIDPPSLAAWVLSGEAHGHRDLDTIFEMCFERDGVSHSAA